MNITAKIYTQNKNKFQISLLIYKERIPLWIKLNKLRGLQVDNFITTHLQEVSYNMKIVWKVLKKYNKSNYLIEYLINCYLIGMKEIANLTLYQRA